MLERLVMTCKLEKLEWRERQLRRLGFEETARENEGKKEETKGDFNEHPKSNLPPMQGMSDNEMARPKKTKR